jgi:chromosome segregation ATPase
MSRESASTESSSGGRTAIIVLGLVCAGVVFALYKRHASASAASATAAKEQASLSNQVAELRTKLALESATLAQVKSNFEHTIEQRTTDLLLFSNRLVHAHLLVQTAQEEARAGQTDLQRGAAAIALLEAQRDELSRQARRVPALEAERADVQKRYDSLDTERDHLARDLQMARLELAEISLKLDDPAFLRIQAEKAEDAAVLRKRMATHPVNPSDRRLRLELQADGSVRTVPPVKTAASR